MWTLSWTAGKKQPLLRAWFYLQQIQTPYQPSNQIVQKLYFHPTFLTSLDTDDDFCQLPKIILKFWFAALLSSNPGDWSNMEVITMPQLRQKTTVRVVATATYLSCTWLVLSHPAHPPYRYLPPAHSLGCWTWDYSGWRRCLKHNSRMIDYVTVTSLFPSPHDSQNQATDETKPLWSELPLLYCRIACESWWTMAFKTINKDINWFAILHTQPRRPTSNLWKVILL